MSVLVTTTMVARESSGIAAEVIAVEDGLGVVWVLLTDEREDLVDDRLIGGPVWGISPDNVGKTPTAHFAFCRN